MRLVKFSYKKSIRWGVWENEEVTLLENSPFNKISITNEKLKIRKVRLLPPAEATKIILVGLNYKDHAKELKMKVPEEPIIFLKPPTTLVGNNDKIIYPKQVNRLDYEAELAVVIRVKCKNVSIDEADKYILGYTCLNDVTARDIQKKDGQWTRAKSFDTFCPLGPFLETEFISENSRIRLYLNGELKQDSSTNNFIFSVRYLISFISSIMTLFPGDVVSTGTPAGIGPMKRRDTVEVEIDGIGRLRNYVV
jgi:2-keto-4-pentenoate hydratase/2-oxohepta-3-ene-1,7-dioic acid hydratase in catechol pathway